MVLRKGETCFSDCGENLRQRRCAKRVLDLGLSFIKANTCHSGMECVGPEHRVLCKAVRTADLGKVGVGATSAMQLR